MFVRQTLDLDHPLRLSAEQEARLRALVAMPDELIDYSDAPFRPDAVWTQPSAGRPPASHRGLSGKMI